MMTIDVTQIAQRAFNTPLMLDPGKAAVIAQSLGSRFLGLRDGAAVTVLGSAVAARPEHLAPRAASMLGDEVHHAARRKQTYSVIQGVAVIPVVGTLVRRGSWVGQNDSGVTSYEGLSAQLRAAALDPDVRAVALEIDSFGGEAAGIFDLGETIRAVREAKPVHAFVSDYALSAGYAIASQADTITVPRFGEAGSIGVVCMHVDYSGHLENEGVTVTLVHSGARKVDGNPYQPLPESVRDRLQRDGDAMWQAFAEMVGTGRGGRLSAQAALALEAEVLTGADAVAAGLCDEVASARDAFDDLVRAAAAPRARPVQGQVAAAVPMSRWLSGLRFDQAGSPSELRGGLAAPVADSNAAPAPAAQETLMNWESVTSAALREHRADLVEEIERAARLSASSETETAVAAAVGAERARMAEIDAIAVDGHAALTARAKSEGWSAEKLALEMVKADRKAGAGYLDGRRAADSAAHVEPMPVASETRAATGTPEERAVATWEGDAALRAEFNGNKAAYLAYAKAAADGRARVLSRAN